MRTLILGGIGMLGHKLFEVLVKECTWNRMVAGDAACWRQSDRLFMDPFASKFRELVVDPLRPYRMPTSSSSPMPKVTTDPKLCEVMM